jgi:hypothetical protein
MQSLDWHCARCREPSGVLTPMAKGGGLCNRCLDEARSDAQNHTGSLASLREENERLRLAIQATLELADRLNSYAACGAGFHPHWGERVIQAVEPLRNVGKFRDQTLEHNKLLLASNGEFLAERDAALDRIRALEGERDEARADLRKVGARALLAMKRGEHVYLQDGDGEELADGCLRCGTQSPNAAQGCYESTREKQRKAEAERDSLAAKVRELREALHEESAEVVKEGEQNAALRSQLGAATEALGEAWSVLGSSHHEQRVADLCRKAMRPDAAKTWEARVRDAALEEAAKVAESWTHDDDAMMTRLRAMACAKAIRSLKSSTTGEAPPEPTTERKEP